MKLRDMVRLSVDLGDEPPTEILVFQPGANTTTKGTILFDDVAAKQVMSAYERHGVELMIDLEHLSLDSDAPNFDPDARGYAKLAVRDGALWMTDIRWTADGAARLRDKRQRYISPCVIPDAKGRPSRVFNVALTAQPATDFAQPLMAASAVAGGPMNAEEIKAALDAIEAGDAAKAIELLKAIIATAAAGGESAEPPSEEPPAEMAEDMDPEKEDEAIAMTARRLTGKRRGPEVVAALTALRDGREQSTTLASEVATLRRTVLAGELRELIRANPRKVASPKQEAYVLSLSSVESARAYLDTLPESVSAPLVPAAVPPATDAVTLTDADREVAKLTGRDLAKVLEFKKRERAQQQGA